MALNTLTGEGCFDKVTRDAINTNFGVTAGLSTIPVKLSGTADAIPVAAGTYIITTGSADATTLAAPVAGTDDGKVLIIYSATAFAHTLTSTGNLITGTTGKTGVLTWAAIAGAGVILMAYNGKWILVVNQTITLTS